MEITLTCQTCGGTFTRTVPSFCCRACMNRNPDFIAKQAATKRASGRVEGNSPSYKGGWIQRGYGGHEHFVMLVPRAERADHPSVNARGYMPRAHYVWNQAHPDDRVQRGEVVHHRNADSMDDRPENLMKFPGHGGHNTIHGREVAAGRPRDAKGRWF